MSRNEESSYRIRILLHGHEPIEDRLGTVAGKRIKLETWNFPHDPSYFRLRLIGSLDDEVVTYRAISFHPMGAATERPADSSSPRENS